MEITKEFFETCGDASLEGALLNSGLLDPSKEIVLRFRQTSYAWRKENGGPETWLMPEFAPFSFVTSVLNLIRQGYKIKVEFFTV